MAKLNTESMHSEFYPPRARWYSRLWYPWFGFLRALRLEKIHLPNGISVAQGILSLVLPGYAFFANGRWILGWAFVAIYVNAAILFVVALGYPVGNIGFGLMIAAHASSIIFLENYLWRDACRFQLRLALAAITLGIVGFGIYAQLIWYAEQHWLIPLSVRNHIVIVHHTAKPQGIARGDYLMYSLNSTHNALVHNEAVFVREGYGWGRVLAIAGDRVVFSTNSFFVNGAAQKLLPHMPRSGEVLVPEKHWFIWPEFDMFGRGNVGEANISGMMMELSVVSEDQFVGKPFKRWFWRRQIL
jgi:hypothetical protein